MKAILKFKFPKDQADYRLANMSGDMYSVIWDWTEYLRGIYKYSDEDLSVKITKTIKLFGFTIWEKTYTTPGIEKLRDEWSEMLYDNNVNLNSIQ